MGLIRKTLSVSTLGLVNWNSKKERLRAANEELELTRADLEQATEKHSLIRSRLADAERRAEKAELGMLHTARRKNRAARRRARMEAVETAVGDAKRRGSSAIDAAEQRAAELRTQGRRAAKKARKRAAKSAEQAVDTVRDKAEDLIER